MEHDLKYQRLDDPRLTNLINLKDSTVHEVIEI